MTAIKIDPAMIYIADEEFLKAVQQLLGDIEDMQSRVGAPWYGGFSDFNTAETGGDYGATYSVEIEWPNLAISADTLRKQLNRILTGDVRGI